MERMSSDASRPMKIFNMGVISLVRRSAMKKRELHSILIKVLFLSLVNGASTMTHRLLSTCIRYWSVFIRCQRQLAHFHTVFFIVLTDMQTTFQDFAS